jgi:hypothetical protein
MERFHSLTQYYLKVYIKDHSEPNSTLGINHSFLGLLLPKDFRALLNGLNLPFCGAPDDNSVSSFDCEASASSNMAVDVRNSSSRLRMDSTSLSYRNCRMQMLARVNSSVISVFETTSRIDFRSSSNVDLRCLAAAICDSMADFRFLHSAFDDISDNPISTCFSFPSATVVERTCVARD